MDDRKAIVYGLVLIVCICMVASAVLGLRGDAIPSIIATTVTSVIGALVGVVAGIMTSPKPPSANGGPK